MLTNKSRLATYAKHAKVTHAIYDIASCHDYKIVNVIHNPHNNHPRRLMSTFERSEQASPISEGVVEIQINSHLATENNLTTQTHMSHRGNTSDHLLL
jgi:hypothetical protein